jgi:hypothetical protein
VKHGARRSDLALSREPRVVELVEMIRESQPVDHPADAGACTRLALVYRRIEAATAALDQADADFADSPLAAFRDGADFHERLREDLSRWIRLASKIETELGRTPTSRAKLGLHIALGSRTLTVLDLHAEVEEAS